MTQFVNAYDVLRHAGANPAHLRQDGPRRDRPGDTPRVYMTYNRMSVWIDPDDQALVEATPPPGKRKVTFRGPGWQCTELGCQAIALPDGKLCSRHAKYQARYAAQLETISRNYQRHRDAETRRSEAARRTREILDESADALEQLGIRPDTVKVAQSGAIEMPSETFADLLRRAVEQAAMEAL